VEKTKISLREIIKFIDDFEHYFDGWHFLDGSLKINVPFENLVKLNRTYMVNFNDLPLLGHDHFQHPMTFKEAYDIWKFKKKNRENIIKE